MVWVKDPASFAQARAAIRARIASGRFYVPSERNVSVDAVKADYSLTELGIWRDSLMASSRTLGLIMLDLDEGQNRVTVGVQPGGDYSPTSTFAAKLARLNVPFEAVRTIEMTEAQDRSLSASRTQSATNLGVYADTLAGGFRYVWHLPDSSRSGGCTIGFTAQAGGGVKGFVSAAHCSPTIWETNGTGGVMGQPGYGSGVIGYELYDPNPGICPWLWPCGTYRYSDANFYVVTGRDVKVGYLAKPNTRSALLPSFDTTIVNGTYIEVADQTSSIVQGSTMDKIGATSGWSYGEVLRTCYTFFNNGRALRCAYSLWSVVYLGDSGGPVFYYNPATDKAVATGIIKAGDFDQGRQVTVFSKLMYVQSELSGSSSPGPFTILADTEPGTLVPSVSIVGVSVMQPSATCYWYITTNFSYNSVNWSVGGNTVGTNHDLSFSSSTDFVLEVFATNGSMGAGAVKHVVVSGEAGTCYVE